MKSKIIPLVLMLAATAAHAQELRLRGPADYPFTSQPGANPGFFVEAAEDILKAHGQDPNYRVVPWNAMIAGGESGLYDCLLGIHTSEAPELNFTSEAWTVMSPHLYVRTEDPLKYQDLSSFQNRLVGVLKDSRMEAALQPMKKYKPDNLKVFLRKEGQGMDEMVRELRFGQIDVIAAPKTFMDHYLKEHDLTKVIRDVGRFTKPVPLYIACSNKSNGVQLVKWLNQGRFDLMRDGKWQALKEKYGVE
ncbi:substrate-binding periplasmic protein [Gallaecimonas mangrovi]|uniref:substrate-binding periplasmic protein n=1 Tax=Gallaecimonas mangrovi TaxID=2291597 RepID=UPI000E1FD080|nr:transporter substrate-binding domain-containing protein [Gallaecimonas mangrovi]